MRDFSQSPGHAIPHSTIGEFTADTLALVKSSDLPQRREVATALLSSTNGSSLPQLVSTNRRFTSVVNDKDEFVGIFTARDVRAYIYDESIWQLTVARDIMTSRILSVTPDDDLNPAMRRFTQRNIDEFPIVDPDNGSLRCAARRPSSSTTSGYATTSRSTTEHQFDASRRALSPA